MMGGYAVWPIGKRVFFFRPIVILAATFLLRSATPDVVWLKDGPELGAPGAFLYMEDKEQIVVVFPSGETRKVAADDIALMELDELRQIELNNGDILHGTGVRLQEGEVCFVSELLGQFAVPLDVVVGISPPAGKEIAKPPVLTDSKESIPVETRPPQPPRKWDGQVQFGFASTSGRQDTQNANLSAQAVRESKKTRWTLSAGGRYGATDGDKNVDAQEAAAKFDHFLSQRVYWYADLSTLRDPINLIDFRISPGVGVGRKFITAETILLEGEAGVTEIWERQSSPLGEKRTESDLYARIGLRFAWTLKPGAKFTEEIEVFPGLTSSDEFRYRSVSQLTAALMERLSLAAGFTVNYDSDPPGDAPKTSTHASTGFIYNF
jgi:putative salt-induced outer membrane protein